MQNISLCEDITDIVKKKTQTKTTLKPNHKTSNPIQQPLRGRLGSQR